MVLKFLVRVIQNFLTLQSRHSLFFSQEEIKKLSELEGTAGVIAVDAKGNIAMEFNTSGMFRGYIKSTGEKKVAIFKEN